MKLNRRNLLAAAAAAPTAAWLSAAAPIAARAQGAAGSELVLLGTKGGPRVGGNRANPATLIRVDGTPYLIDCGYGCARQL
ncbi:MAG: MBL fold metallo-hydrolase, partial [Burkholderiales bacterium]